LSNNGASPQIVPTVPDAQASFSVAPEPTENEYLLKVGVGVDVFVGVGVFVGVTVGVCVFVGVTVGVCVFVGDAVFVGVCV